MSEHPSIFDVTPAEKLQLVEGLWGDLAATPDSVPIHQWQKDELAAALHATGEGEREVVDVETARLDWIVNSEAHRRARESLRRQQGRDAIAQSIAGMEAGAGISMDDARRLTQRRLLARKQ